MDTKKIRLQEEAISEILVADTDLESGAEASNVKDDFDKEEENNDDDDDDDDNNNKNKPQQKLKHRLQQVADYQAWDWLKEGTQIFIILLVQQKV